MYMVVLSLSEPLARFRTNDFDLGNEHSEAQGALRLELNVSRFWAHSFVFLFLGFEVPHNCWTNLWVHFNELSVLFCIINLSDSKRVV